MLLLRRGVVVLVVSWGMACGGSDQIGGLGGMGPAGSGGGGSGGGTGGSGGGTGGTGGGGADASTTGGRGGTGGTGGSGGAGGGSGRGGSGGTGGAGGMATGGTGGTGGSGGMAGMGPPLPGGKWMNVTSNLANMASECGNLVTVSAKPDEDMVIAGIAKKGLWASRDGGGTWTPLGTGPGSSVITNRPQAIVYDPMNPRVFWEAGIYGDFVSGVHRTDDSGLTFKKLGNIGHNDLVTVDFTDPERKTLLAGAHEATRKLFRSTDGGMNWMDIGQALPADSHFSTYPLIIDTRTFLLGACGNFGSQKCGVIRSTDGGATWTYASDKGAMGTPLLTKNGTVYWPLRGNGGLIKSTDKGQTWTQPTGNGRLLTATPIELPDGRLAAVGPTHVMISPDGATWSQLGDPIGYQAAGLTYSAQRKAIFVWRWDCGTVVPANGILRAPFDHAAR